MGPDLWVLAGRLTMAEGWAREGAELGAGILG